MKNYLSIFIILLLWLPLTGQNLSLKIEGAGDAETRIIDSLSYKRMHENARAVADEAALMCSRLTKAGYLENEITGMRKVNDTLFLYTIATGRQTRAVHIYTGKLEADEKALLEISKDTLVLAPAEVEDYMNSNVAALERKGYSLSSMRLVNYTRQGNVLHAELTLKTEKKRSLDDIVLEGYPKFPEGIRRNITRQYKGKTFNQQTLERVNKDFNSLRFVSQARYPEILFKKDTTKVYVYLQKAKPNVFDGFIGFNNDESSNLVFTGYLDLALNNILNSGEKLNLFWKSDGNRQTTFNASAELPYLFKSPIGIKAALRIFRQDSTFQTTVTEVNLGYYFSYNSKLFFGRQQTQSTDIQNQNTASLSDFSSAFWTSTYEFTRYTVDDFLFPEKTVLSIKAGFGSRDSKAGDSDQYFAQISAAHNLYLNRNNIINLKNQTFYLNSSNYVINELYRFGGINSIRGFNENSLQASLYSALMVEYRYILSPSIYVHSITDYGYFQDETSELRDNLLGLGFGFGLLTKTGLFNIVYANGSTRGQQIRLSNSVIHLSFKTNF
ncbi:hypothetical protein CHU92_06075 [Flavobacterium cyanobacteriorum]|uniref:Bacterial surface antigen (D15) domain-containing protein n=1 Tax=Flavobacterium cyanobacteriorum TaxID=2022802 RepID=A0A255ZBF0_9FLAO|nr:hypothetical protein [Flavobacterium cyanobacteriorum]OYQ38195.1 hypothetical protein CHU92_06075 [Flavobacterium cyanobacteriorum]